MQRKRLLRLQRQRQKDQQAQDLLKASTFFEVVQQISGDPEEIERQQKLEKRWSNYKLAQKFMNTHTVALPDVGPKK